MTDEQLKREAAEAVRLKPEEVRKLVGAVINKHNVALIRAAGHQLHDREAVRKLTRSTVLEGMRDAARYFDKEFSVSENVQVEVRDVGGIDRLTTRALTERGKQFLGWLKEQSS